MGFATREREFWHSTDAIEYCVQHSEDWFRIRGPSRNCGAFFATSIRDSKPLNPIACIGSEGRKEEDYYKLHEREFITRLWSHYPDLSSGCADKVAKTFTEFLVIANASHHCPERTDGGFTILHVLLFKIQPRSHTVPLPVELIIFEEMEEEEEMEEDEEEEEEEAVCPRTRSATRASITELLKAKAVAGGIEEDGNCGICMEGIETPRNTLLRMPCSHPFHQFCLLRWLDNGHSCPICRYQLPAAQHQSDLTD